MTDDASNAGSPSINRVSRRIKLSDEQVETISRDDLVKHWRELDTYVDSLELQSAAQEAEIMALRESEERLKVQYSDSSHREKVLVRRLATKEHEVQEFVNQIAELKAAQTPGPAALRSALLDPAVNLLLQRLRQELVATRARLEETQNELNAWKFTPDSNTGKRLMAKCRLLYQENEDLGRMISSGRLAKLEGELALQKSFSEEVKKSQSELDEFLQELDEDVEGMQSTIYYLQQELRKCKDTISSLQQGNDILKNGNISSTYDNDDSEEDDNVSNQDKGVDDSREWEDRTISEQNRKELQVSSAVSSKRTSPCEEVSEACSEENKLVNVDAEKREEQKFVEAVIDESSSDSGTLVIKVDADEIVDEMMESNINGTHSDTNEHKNKNEEDDDNDINRTNKKRTLSSEDDSNDSDNVPLIKKLRRDSELSLHYNEDEDDEMTLTNGEVTSRRNGDE